MSLLNKKSELDKEFEKRKMRQQQRDDEENRRKHRSSFDIRMEEQANKIVLVGTIDVYTLMMLYLYLWLVPIAVR